MINICDFCCYDVLLSLRVHVVEMSESECCSVSGWYAYKSLEEIDINANVILASIAAAKC
jgi:hypothetical protein